MQTSPPSNATFDPRLSSPTLACVLAGPGHGCPGLCAAAADELGAQPWFVRRRPTLEVHGPATLVVIDAGDFEGSVDRSRDLMRSINDCLRPDGIRVGERRIDDAGFALAVVRPPPRPVLDRRAADEHLRLVRGSTS